MITLVIGNTDISTYNESVKKYKNSILLHSENFNSIDLSTNENVVYHSALGDLTFEQLYSLALKVDVVEYLNCLDWHNPAGLIQTETLCNYISHVRPVIGWTQKITTQCLTQDISRLSDGPMLWTFGCSHTAGDGLNNPDIEVYGALLSKRLNLPWKNIAKSGSSTKWGLIHLAAAEIRPHDIVIWATTSAERYQHGISFSQIQETQLAHASREAILFYTDPQIYWDHINTINIGVSHLRSIQSKFILLSIVNQNKLTAILEAQMSHYREWCYIPDFNQHDLGTDNIHVGPKGHINLAQRIENHLKLLNYV